MHAKADAEKRHLIFSRVLNRTDLAFDTTFAESAWHQNAIITCEVAQVGSVLKFSSIQPMNVHSDIITDTSMNESFSQTLIGILQINIFPDHGDINFTRLGFIQNINNFAPGFQVRYLCRDSQFGKNNLRQSLGFQGHGNFVDAFDIHRCNYRIDFNVTKQRDFLFKIFSQLLFRAAKQNVWLDSNFTQFLDTMLCRLGL